MNVVALMQTSEGAESLKETLKDVGTSKIEIFVDNVSNIYNNENLKNGHDVLLVDIDARSEKDTETLKHFIKNNHNAKPVIVTSTNTTAHDIHRIMEIGADHFLPHPIREIDFFIAMDHASRYKQEKILKPQEKGKIISFLKAGGGVGATTIAVQGSAFLAKGSRRIKSAKVCVLDLDVQFGAVSFYFDTNRSTGLADLLETPERIDHSLLSRVMSQHESGVDVLSAPPEIMPLESVSETLVNTLFDLAIDEYDFIFVDLPQVWTSWTQNILSRSDRIIITAQPSVTALQHIGHQLSTLKDNGIADTSILLVLNRHKGGWGTSGAVFVKESQKVLGRKFDYFVANNYDLVRGSTDEGVLFHKIQKRTRTEKDINKMFDNIRKEFLAEDRQTKLNY